VADEICNCMSGEAPRQELLSTFRRSRHIWSERAEMKAALWSGFAAELDATCTSSDAFDAYSRFLSQRMQMASEDVKRIFEEYQEVCREMARREAESPLPVQRHMCSREAT
jgi:hypothetical protein